MRTDTKSETLNREQTQIPWFSLPKLPSLASMLRNFCFLPSRHSKPRRTCWFHHRSLSKKVSKFWVFWFALCCVLGLRGVFVTVGLEVGYRDWQKHTTGGLSDTFQITGRQSDFDPNHRWVMYNYPLLLLLLLLLMVLHKITKSYTRPYFSSIERPIRTNQTH